LLFDPVSRSKNTLRTILMIFIALAILGGLVWANTFYARTQPGGKDFLVPWLAAQTFLQYGDSPYAEPTTQRIQLNYYNRLAFATEDPLRLNIPFPVVLFYFPFALVTDFSLARGLWMTCLEFALVILAFLSLQLIGWKPARALLPVILIFSVLWIYGLFPLVEGQAVIFVALAVVALLSAMRDGRDELAGSLLVFAFFKPDIAGIFMLFIFWWAIGHRRGRILAGFLMSLTLLLAVSFFILPDWFMPFVRAAISHLTHNPGFTPGRLLAFSWPVVGPRLGWALTGILLVVFFVEWRALRGKDFRHLLWTVSLTLAGTPLLGIPVIPQNYVLLFFPLVLFLSILDERWSRPGRWGVAAWALLAIFVGLWLVARSLPETGGSSGLSLGITLAFPIFLILGLYWMRWWAVRPPRTWSDSLP
jgi:hypothetical protein